VSSWAQAGSAVALLGVVLASPPIVFIGAAMLLIRVVGEVWPRRVLAGLDYDHDVTPDRTVVGEDVELRLSLWNRTRLPAAWASAEDTITDAIGVRPASSITGPPVPFYDSRASLRVAGPLRPYERISRRFCLVPLRRGVHEIGPVSLGVAELFGTQAPKRDGATVPRLLVARPLMAPVAGRLPTEAPLARERAERSLFNDPTLYAGVRPYASGDPVRSIHWRASARLASLQTKRFEPSLSAQQMIVLDVQTLEGEWWVLAYDDALFEDLCVAALSVTRALITRETPCGFVAAAYTGSLQRFIFLPPRADRTHLGRVADALARLTPISSAPLTQVLAILPRRVAKGTSLVVLTGRDPASTAAISRRLRETGFPVHFLLFGPAAGNASQARHLGLSAWSARLEGGFRSPRSLVVES
jgi:uncharacterized protein (DUF58 family)